MNKQRKTKQNVHRNKKKSKERKIVENFHSNLHSQSFPQTKSTEPAKSTPISPNPTNEWKAEYVKRISCPTRRNFYESASPNITNIIRTKNNIPPPQPPKNMRKVFPLIEGDKNIYKQKRNAKGVYFSKVDRDPPIIQEKYNTWKVKNRVENRAMNTKPPLMSTYARHQQKEEEKKRKLFHEDIIRRGHMVHPRNSLIKTQGDPTHVRNLTLTEIMHVDIKPNYNLSNSPFRNRSPAVPALKAYAINNNRNLF